MSCTQSDRHWWVYKARKVQQQHHGQTFNFFTELQVILQLGLDKQNLIPFLRHNSSQFS